MQRARIVLHAASGLADTEIAARLDTTAGLVGRWRRRFAEHGLEGLRDQPRPGRPRRFPPEQVAEVKAIACQLPIEHGLPLGRFSRAELHRLVIERGVTDASATTIWRWLTEDAIKPWQTRSWLLVRHPDFQAKAHRVLDLYARKFEGHKLLPDELVISADENPSCRLYGAATRALRRDRDGRYVTSSTRRRAGLSRCLGCSSLPHLRTL